MSSQLLTPTRIYVKPVLALLKSFPKDIAGISHITGGAFYDKISRILPKDIDLNIRKGSWPVPKIFSYIQNRGNVEEREMFHTLNMGIGLVLIVRPASGKKIISSLAKSGLKSWVIGQAIKGNKKVKII